MRPILAFVFLAASTHIQLVDEVLRIPAGDWRSVEIGLQKQAAEIIAAFETQSGSPQVRLSLMRSEDLERLRRQQTHPVLEMTPLARTGGIRHRVRVAGNYVIVVDNRMEKTRPADVHLRVALDFGPAPGPQVTRLSPGRQLAVIVISFAVFFAIVTYATRRLLRGIRR